MKALTSFFDCSVLGEAAFATPLHDSHPTLKAVTLAVLALVAAAVGAYAVCARLPISAWTRAFARWRHLPWLSRRDVAARESRIVAGARNVERTFDEFAVSLAPHLCADDQSAFKAYRHALSELRNQAERASALAENEP
jgi:hypothetical protein